MIQLAKFWAGDTWIHAWLAGRARGRWATVRGRWIRAVLTAALLVTGLSAWALAIIQPWTMKTTDHHVFAASAGVTPDRVRSAAVDLEDLLGERVAPVSGPLRRNPFDHAGPAGEEAAASDSKSPAPRPASVADLAAEEPTPQEILEKVKGLRLEVILITPEGPRWAVINGENSREGDEVAGFRIVEIQQGRTRLQRGGVTCLLRMD